MQAGRGLYDTSDYPKDLYLHSKNLLYHCTHVRDFWLSVINWLYTILGLSTEHFSETDIIFGYWNNNKEIVLINRVILLGKQLIYR